ncbi:phosphonate C-P lyase system protein PhnH [Roseococcus sp. SDR]|uniref:phosphonate C-P lyase system protein PhnH n=1 Tax=Roseococcus sp. SDR TaxID=2835532 RepID=UPI001BCC9D24|nr:phosphonate C-P lyase system protein PhnH [Roseococcus sp. SDR]MBS7789510.1 phosphonate C-P lyase system protein PhnH [Roseococcus sp. SDR]MBV1844824.1 phosphonate C-P lyase system protein PhnH [Roseococcus sp. SDR]
MKPGFSDPVFGAQSGFAALMNAMARPGRIQDCNALHEPPPGLDPAAAAALLTLADAETPLWTDAEGEARDWIAFHTGAPLVEDVARAQFLLATRAMPALASVDLGTDETPQDSATLIVQVATLDDASGWRLTGPGIQHEHRLTVTGLPADFAVQWARNRTHFPRGVDVVLCAGTRLAGLPRTTRITEDR